MFNVFLPKLLESGSGSGTSVSTNPETGQDGQSPGGKSLEASLWDVVIFTIGGCPGAIVSAFFC